MSTTVKIDFVSDVSCPWCIIGLQSLEQALARLEGEISADLHFQPFELNPGMPPEGQDTIEHLTAKYNLSPEQLERNRANIHARGKEVGFTFGHRGRVYNTFDAHRLLHWAELEGRQSALKHALFDAYFTNSENMGDHDVLVAAAEKAGLPPVRAREILADGIYADEVRERENFYLRQGINSVPAIIINARHLIQGGQPAEVFEQALRQVAALPAGQ